MDREDWVAVQDIYPAPSWSIEIDLWYEKGMWVRVVRMGLS